MEPSFDLFAQIPHLDAGDLNFGGHRERVLITLSTVISVPSVVKFDLLTKGIKILMDYTADNLLLRSTNEDRPGVFAKVAAEQAGWDYLNMVALRLEKGKTFGITIADYEYVAVVLTGQCNIHTSKGNFDALGY